MTEIVGLDQSIAYVRGLADLAGEHVPDGNEGYLAHLTAAGLHGAAVDTARQMQTAFAAARAAAQHHATELDKQRGVQHAYDQTPDAGDKDYHQAPAAAPAATAPTAPTARREAMRDYGLFWCPDWCVRHAEEDQWEQHFGEWTVLRTRDGEEIAVRPWSSWHAGEGDHVEVRVTVAAGSDPDSGVMLTPGELDELRDLLDAAQEQSEQDDPGLLVPAYDGAEDDEDGTSDWAQAHAGTTDVPDSGRSLQPA
jgi:hypothetical protein